MQPPQSSFLPLLPVPPTQSSSSLASSPHRKGLPSTLQGHTLWPDKLSQNNRKTYQRLPLKTLHKQPVSALGLWLNSDAPSRAWFLQLSLLGIYMFLVFYIHIPSLSLLWLPCQLFSTISASPNSLPAATLGSLPLLECARQPPILQLNSQLSPLLQAPSLTSLKVIPDLPI